MVFLLYILILKFTVALINTTDPATIRSLCSFQGGVLFSDKSKCSLYKITSDLSVSLFAGTKTQGSLDSPVSSCHFMQPGGICTEFDHVVYVCDLRSSAIKLLSGMGECGKYLEAVRKIYDAFSVHKKGTRPQLKTLKDAVELVQSCQLYLTGDENAIREVCSKTGAFSGPEGNAPSKLLIQ